MKTKYQRILLTKAQGDAVYRAIDNLFANYACDEIGPRRLVRAPHTKMTARAIKGGEGNAP